jgi:ubiquinone/menaquinone biosynthesis C-methylase UbiE
MTTPDPVKVEHPAVAALYDAYMWPQERLGFRRQRQRIGEQATGSVLEIAAGTGLTFPFYVHAREVLATDPDPHMLKRARRRAARAPCPVQLLQADAEALPLEDDTFDTAVMAFALCTIPHPESAVREANRVLKPDGRLLFLEHVRSRGPRVARLQDIAAPGWSHLTGGCHPNRPSVETIERHFKIDALWQNASSCKAAPAHSHHQHDPTDNVAMPRHTARTSRRAVRHRAEPS